MIGHIKWVAALAMLLFLLAAPRIAKAYVIIYGWPQNNTTWRFSSSVPLSFYDSIRHGANVWTWVYPSSWYFTEDSASSSYIQYGAIDGSGGTLASFSPYTYVNYPNVLSRFTIKFDSIEPWNVGFDSPTSNEMDLIGIAAHEFGHAVGLGHTNVSCSTSDYYRPTMCPSLLKGQIEWRTLESDDAAGLNFLYP